MISYQRIILANGLTVISHYDPTTPLAVVNILYNVGSKDEDPNRTGFAHLFEHLMFEGSDHAPSYDAVVQEMCGENNAFTNTDITNYYVTIPAQYIERALWLESDRMQYLTLSQEKLKLQQHVVSEEYKQRYLNQPYGDLWLLMRPLLYKKHPYQWPTIGKNLRHIQEASLEEVSAFYQKHYSPANAILVISGNVAPETAFSLSEKWFGPLASRPKYIRNIAPEPNQRKARRKVVERPVPHAVVLKSYLMCPHSHPDFYALDLLSDLLSFDDSSRFQRNLVHKKRVFNEASAVLSGEVEAGSFYLYGLLREGVSINKAMAAMGQEIDMVRQKKVSNKELDKVKTNVATQMAKSDLGIRSIAQKLAFFEMLGDLSLIHSELEHYKAVNPDRILEVAQQYLNDEQSSLLEYLPAKNKH